MNNQKRLLFTYDLQTEAQQEESIRVAFLCEAFPTVSSKFLDDVQDKFF